MDSTTGQNSSETASSTEAQGRPVNLMQTGIITVGAAGIVGAIVHFGLKKGLGFTFVGILLGAGLGLYADAQIQQGNWLKG